MACKNTPRVFFLWPTIELNTVSHLLSSGPEDIVTGPYLSIPGSQGVSGTPWKFPEATI